MQNKPVSVLIPAYNEEKSIVETVSAALSIDCVGQVIVIDDGSEDSTAQFAANSGAVVLSSAANAGKGSALSAGARYVKGDYILFLDADLGESAVAAEALLAPLFNNTADMCVAVFPPSGRKAGFGLAKGLARAGIKHFTGLHMEAPLSGQRALKSMLYFDLLPFARGFGVEVDLTVRAALKGYRIKEVPVNMRHRQTGRDIVGILHRGKQFLHVSRTLMGHFIYCG